MLSSFVWQWSPLVAPSCNGILSSGGDVSPRYVVTALSLLYKPEITSSTSIMTQDDDITMSPAWTEKSCNKILNAVGGSKCCLPRSCGPSQETCLGRLCIDLACARSRKCRCVCSICHQLVPTMESSSSSSAVVLVANTNTSGCAAEQSKDSSGGGVFKSTVKTETIGNYRS
jgi:hypothetical protein